MFQILRKTSFLGWKHEKKVPWASQLIQIIHDVFVVLEILHDPFGVFDGRQFVGVAQVSLNFRPL